MKKILVVFGTRPEAIKMTPLIRALRKYGTEIDFSVCVTAQHRQMLDQVLNFFDIVPDFDLNLMRDNQDLYQLTADILMGMKNVLETFRPDYVLVHGDTTTSAASALAAYYAKIPVGHVEAGLRTYDKYAPFPEEINRQLTGRMASLHFAPTDWAKANLLREAIPEETIYVTGNTVIDALYWAKDKLADYSDEEITMLESMLDLSKKIVLVTAHRRENFGQGITNICEALLQISKREDVEIVFPVHPNPAVQKPVYDALGDIPTIKLISPVGYPAFTWLMLQSHFILTDSGGIQEEAPGLGKPVLVMREASERPEAIAAGTVRLVGTDVEQILQEATAMLAGGESYQAMSNADNPYGDGFSAGRIVKILINS